MYTKNIRFIGYEKQMMREILKLREEDNDET